MKKILFILALCFLALGVAACSGATANAYFTTEQLKLQVGDNYKVQYVGDDVQLKSTDESVAEISLTGVVIAVKEGKTKLQLVSNGNVVDELDVEVVKSSYVAPEDVGESSIYRIVLDVTEKRIYPNGNFVLTAKVFKNNTVCEDVVTWDFGGADNPIITATSSANRLTVTGVGYGITKVFATIGEFTAVCKVTVSDINYKTLPAPVLSDLTQTEISWQAVENAEGYRISVDNGVTYEDVEQTTFSYGGANPLQIMVYAVGNGINFEDSAQSKITQSQVKFSCGDRLIFYTDKTVSGVENTDKTTAVAVNVFANVGGQDVEIANQQFSIKNNNVVSMEGNVFAPVKEGEAEIGLVGVSDITLSAVVGTPIKTKVDMDTLGFAYKNGVNNELWTSGNVYLLANDIDYAVDVSEKDKGLRMTDDNDDADLWDRYLIPIAASYEDYKNTASRSGAGTFEWGIFGKIGADGKFFYGIFDGAGYQIKNAVVPYGTMFAYGDMQLNHGQNFIGSLVYGAKLRNVAFTNLEFEDPLQIAKAGANNPYYTDANPNNADTTLKKGGYITGNGIFNLNYGSYLALNASNRTGIVGQMQNAVISNVYVEAALKSGTYGIGAKNGLIVAEVVEDHYANGAIYYGTYGRVENCVVVTSYYNATNVHSFADAGGQINAGMAAVIGRSGLSGTAVVNCFAIGALDVGLKSGALVKCETIFTPNPDMFKAYKYSTNCAVYSSMETFEQAQADVIDQITILNSIS